MIRSHTVNCKCIPCLASNTSCNTGCPLPSYFVTADPMLLAALDDIIDDGLTKEWDWVPRQFQWVVLWICLVHHIPDLITLLVIQGASSGKSLACDAVIMFKPSIMLCICTLLSLESDQAGSLHHLQGGVAQCIASISMSTGTSHPSRSLTHLSSSFLKIWRFPYIYLHLLSAN